MFFFNDTATTEIYTLSLHDALPIYGEGRLAGNDGRGIDASRRLADDLVVLRILERHQDRKSTRLNSSHSQISYAVFCLKKKIKYKYKLTELVLRIYLNEPKF